MQNFFSAQYKNTDLFSDNSVKKNMHRLNFPINSLSKI